MRLCEISERDSGVEDLRLIGYDDIVTDDSEKASSERSFILDCLQYTDNKHLKNCGNDI